METREKLATEQSTKLEADRNLIEELHTRTKLAYEGSFCRYFSFYSQHQSPKHFQENSSTLSSHFSMVILARYSVFLPSQFLTRKETAKRLVGRERQVVDFSRDLFKSHPEGSSFSFKVFLSQTEGIYTMYGVRIQKD